jgi:isopentenyl-diphosphate delta-isomerase
MGIAVDLAASGTFLYQAQLDNGLIEHELDHLFVGRFNGAPRPDPDEAAEWKWEPRAWVESDCAEHPDRYTAWFPLALRALPDS